MKKNDLIGGLTTFVTMAYILIVNPQLLSRAGMDFDAVLTATILSSALATIAMGLIGNYPFVVAPGMGLNAYFTFGVVLENGFSWQQALGITFFSGSIVLLLTLLGLRSAILHAVPRSIRYAISSGIGLFLIFIAFQQAHIVINDDDTLVTLGDMMTPAPILAFLGLVVTAAMAARGWPTAILTGIFLASVTAWGLSLAPFYGFLAHPPSLAPSFLQLDFSVIKNPTSWPIIATFVFIALFDTVGTLTALAEQGNFLVDGRLPRAKRVMSMDAVGTITGALIGTSPHTTYLESASGIAAGARTGRSSLLVAALLLIALLFSPLFSSIPTYAAFAALITVGALMMQPVVRIHWDDPTEAIPASLIIASISLTYSIADGIGVGLVAYPLIKLLAGKARETSPVIWLISFLFACKFIFLE